MYRFTLQEKACRLCTSNHLSFISLSGDTGQQQFASNFELKKIHLSLHCGGNPSICAPEHCRCLLIYHFPLVASLHLVNSNLPSTVPRNFENIMNFIPEKAIGCILYVECLRSWFHATLALTQNGCEYSSVLAVCCFGVCCIVFEHCYNIP